MSLFDRSAGYSLFQQRYPFVASATSLPFSARHLYERNARYSPLSESASSPPLADGNTNEPKVEDPKETPHEEQDLMEQDEDAKVQGPVEKDLTEQDEEPKVEAPMKTPTRKST